MFYEPDIQKLRNIHSLLSESDDFGSHPENSIGEFSIEKDIADWYTLFASDVEYQDEVYNYLFSKQLVDVGLMDWRKRLLGRYSEKEQNELDLFELDKEMTFSMTEEHPDSKLRPLIPIQWQLLEMDEEYVFGKLIGYEDKESGQKSLTDFRKLGFTIKQTYRGEKGGRKDVIYITAKNGKKFYSYKDNANGGKSLELGLWTDAYYDDTSKTNVKRLNKFLNDNADRGADQWTSLEIKGDKFVDATGFYNTFGTTWFGGTPREITVDTGMWKWNSMMFHHTEIAHIAHRDGNVPREDIQEYFRLAQAGLDPMTANNKFTEFITKYEINTGEQRKWDVEANQAIRHASETELKSFLSSGDLGFGDSYEAVGGKDIVRWHSVGYGEVELDISDIFRFDGKQFGNKAEREASLQIKKVRSWKATKSLEEMQKITGINGILRAMDKSNVHWGDGSLARMIKGDRLDDEAWKLINSANENLKGTGWEIKDGDGSLDVYYKGNKVHTAYGDEDLNKNNQHAVLSIREYLYAKMSDSEAEIMSSNFLKSGDNSAWINKQKLWQIKTKSNITAFDRIENVWQESTTNGFLDIYLDALRAAKVSEKNIELVRQYIEAEVPGSEAKYTREHIGKRFKELIGVTLNTENGVEILSSYEGIGNILNTGSIVDNDIARENAMLAHDIQKIMIINERFGNAKVYHENADLNALYNEAEGLVLSNKTSNYFLEKYKKDIMNADDNTAAALLRLKMEREDLPALFETTDGIVKYIEDEYKELGNVVGYRLSIADDKNAKIVWNTYDEKGDPVIKDGVDWRQSKQGDFSDKEWTKFQRQFYKDVVDVALIIESETTKAKESLDEMFATFESDFGILLDVQRNANLNRGYWDITGEALRGATSSLFNAVPALFEHDAALYNIAWNANQWNHFDRAEFGEISSVGDFVSWGFTAFVEQVPNIALAFLTMGAGNLLNFGTKASALLVGGTFATTSAGQKNAALLARIEAADTAKIQLNNLENAYSQGRISDDYYLKMKSQLNEVIVAGDMTDTERWGSVITTGLIEGGITALGMGTLKVTKNLRGMFAAPTAVGASNIYKYTGLRAFGNAMGKIGIDTGGEILEESAIYMLTEVGDWMTLGDEMDFNQWSEVAVTALVSSGGMNTTSIGYTSLMNHSLMKEERAFLESIDEKYQEVKNELDGLNPNDKRWKNDPKGYEDRRNELLATLLELKKVQSQGYYGLEIDALALSKEDHQKLTVLSRRLTSLYRQAGVKSGDSRSIRDKKISNYIKSNGGKGSDFGKQLSEIEQKMEKIREGKNYNGVREKLFGNNKDRIKEIQKKLEETNPNYKGASLREKLMMEMEYVRELVHDDRLKILKANDKVKKSVEQEVYSEYNKETGKIESMTWEDYKKKHKVKEKTKLQMKMEEEAYKKWSTFLTMSTTEGVINYGKDSNSAEKILKEINEKYPDGLKVVEASDINNVKEMIDAIWNDQNPNYDPKLSLEQRSELDNSIRMGILEIKAGKRNGLIIGNKYIVADKVAADNAIANGDILAGTVISHEFGHWVTDMSLTKTEVKKQSLLLGKFFSKSKKYKYIHDTVLNNVLGRLKTKEIDPETKDFKSIYDSNKSFEEQSDLFYDEYLREIQTQLMKWDFRMHYNQLVKDMEKQGKKYSKGDFNMKTEKDALFYMIDHIKAWREGRMSEVVLAKMESTQAAKQALLDRAGVKKGDSEKTIRKKIEETAEKLEKEKKGEGEKLKQQVEDARVFDDLDAFGKQKSSRKLITERQKLQDQNRKLSDKLSDPKIKERVLKNTERIREINKNPGVQIDDIYEKNKATWWYDKEKKKELDKEFPEDLRNKDPKASQEYKKRLSEIEGTYDGIDEILNLYKPLVKKQSEKYTKVPNFNQELFIDMLLTDPRGVLGMAKYSFDGAKNDSLNGYLNRFLPQRAKDILKTGLVSDAVFLTPEGEAKDITTKKTKYIETSKNIDTKILDNFDLLQIVTIDGKKVVIGDYITKKVKTVIGSLLKQVNKESSPNQQISDLVREIKPILGEILQDVISLSMKGDTRGQMGNNLETWLKKPKNKKLILEGLTTTWLSRNFPNSVEKSVGGRIIKDEKGKTIDFKPNFTKDWKGKKIDKAIASVHGVTSKPEIKRRNENAVKDVSTSEILSKYIKRTDAGITSPKQEPTSLLAYQIGSELGLEMLDNEFNIYLETGKKGDLLNLLTERQLSFLGKEVAVNDLRKQMDRGNIKYSSMANITNSEKVWLFENLENIGNGYFKYGKSIKAAIDELDPDKSKFGKNRNKLIDELQTHFDVHEPVKSNWEAAKKLKIAKSIVDYVREETMSQTLDKNLRSVLGLTKGSLDFNNITQLEDAATAVKELAKIIGKQKTLRFLTTFMYPSGRIGGTKTKRVNGKLVEDPDYWDNLIAKKRKEIKNAIENEKPTKKKRKELKKLIENKKIEAKPGVRYGIFKNKEDFDNMVVKALDDVKEVDIAPDVSQSVTKDLSTPEAVKKDKNAAQANADFLVELSEACNKAMNTNGKNGEPLMTKNDFGMIVLALNNSGMSSTLARAANVKYTVSGKIKSTTHKYEHIIPRKVIAMYFVNNVLNNDKNSLSDLKKILNQFSVAIIPNSVDKIIGQHYASFMPNAWVIGQDVLNRYFNTKTFGKFKLELISVSTGKINQKSKIWSDITDEIIDSQWEKEKSIGDSIRKGRLVKKDSKGMSIWDFDDTLARSKSNVLFTAPDGTKGKLNAEEFAKNGADLLDQGYKFDFSEFSKVVKGEKGPFFQKFVNRIKKFGVENNYILTARPVDSAPAIRAFLLSQGLDIPLKNITGLANSTSEAKALWIADKIADGYNDIYFADDALQNVQAVKNMMDQFDIKSKVQQAKVKHSSTMNVIMNDMLEQVSGIESDLVIDEKKFVSEKMKKRKKKWGFLVPHSAQDFKGLLMAFIAKGKLGEEQMKFFDETLIKPFERAYTEMNSHKQSNIVAFKKLLKQFKSVKRDLRKKLGKFEGYEGNNFTVDQAVRVYLWNKAGLEIPGLSNEDVKTLSDFVKGDEELSAFAEGLDLIMGKGKGYPSPSDTWIVSTIISDMAQNGSLGDSRAEIFQEWIQNKDIIFSKENLNKIEIIYGKKFRDALEDMLYRMENGTNRTYGSNRLSNMYTNWVNGSVGAIMFLNMRSAILQTISFANYINWSDNNPLMMAKAFANLPRFVKDFAFIFNSDMLKQRRAGGKFGVNEAELFQAMSGKKDPIRAAVKFLLEKGFTPTQIADSFAISLGGAAFYRNRINTYKKQGFDEKTAEEKAWQDFQQITETSQQSSRPDLISQQQANPLGRLILAFANTPMQYGRIMNKAIRDLAAGRGDAKTHISKIIYYGAVQSFIFSALQQALFAAMGEDEEDNGEEVSRKVESIGNSMLDSWLIGFGYGGRAISQVKNTIFEYIEQDAKETDDEFFTRADHTYTIIEALNFSPPIGSKTRKVYKGIQTLRFNRDVINEMGFDIDNPAFSAYGNIIEAATNIPLGRLSQKIDNLQQAANSNNENWQRVASLLGWDSWSLGLKDEKIEQLKLEIKKKKKDKKELEKKIERENKEILKKEEKESEQKALIEKFEKEQKAERFYGEKDITCSAPTAAGTRCKNVVEGNAKKCWAHDSDEKLENLSEKEKKDLPNKEGKEVNCSATTKSGNQCKNKTTNKTGLCWAHD